jgi:hypothetical protein
MRQCEPRVLFAKTREDRCVLTHLPWRFGIDISSNALCSTYFLFQQYDAKLLTVQRGGSDLSDPRFSHDSTSEHFPESSEHKRQDCRHEELARTTRLLPESEDNRGRGHDADSNVFLFSRRAGGSNYPRFT